MYRAITACRMCGSTQIEEVLDLGLQSLTGVFPASADVRLTRGPLTLGLCGGCGLVQLLHSYQPAELYGATYGYRSSLNRAMVEHLRDTVASLTRQVPVRDGDVVCDIGSNDGTLLSFYPEGVCTLVGIDPCANHYASYYRGDIQRVPDFFSAKRFRDVTGSKGARIVTSLAMLYDLEQPFDFMREVESILEDDGIWHFEQSYLPTMLRVNAYDTICHEHLEYYGLRQIKWMTDRAGLKITQVAVNRINGGSLAVTVSKQGAPYREATRAVQQFLRCEEEMRLMSPAGYAPFRQAVLAHRERLHEAISDVASSGRTIMGYGASTKGNVLLQFCGLGPRDLPYIAEVNSDKFGRVTPGTHIPIISEAEAHGMRPDCFLVLPWHFRDNIISRETEYLQDGGSLLFPLPHLEVVRA